MHNGSNEAKLSSNLGRCRIFVLLCWTAGLISGIAFSYATEAISSLMRGTLAFPVSIVGLGAVIVLPYLITAFAGFTSQLWILMPLALCKAFSFGACIAAIDLAFSSAGWLIRMLLMFSELAAIPFLLYLWLRFLAGDDQGFRRCTALFAAFSVLIGSIDFWVIAPFLASVI